jgi:hypothetical protein
VKSWAKPRVRLPRSRRGLAFGLAVLLGVLLVGAADGWIVRHYSARAAVVDDSDDYLNAVACPAAGTCWAVGQTAAVQGGNLYTEVRSPLIREEVAGQWHDVRSPDPMSASPALTAVTCPGPRNCWAVGGSATGGVALIEHWGGGAWQLTRSPHSYGAQLQTVACATASLCWAAGGKQSRRNVSTDVLEQWNGRRWRTETGLPLPAGIFAAPTVPHSAGLNSASSPSDNSHSAGPNSRGSDPAGTSPAAAGTDLSFYPVQFSCPQPGHCLIAGVRHGVAAAVSYTGGRWAVVPSPPRLPVLLGCATPDRCLALLRDGHGLVTQTWNGQLWATATAHLPAYPSGLDCTSGGTCWLLGASAALRPQAWRWQDGQWAPASPAAAHGYLAGLACAGRCWAVGGAATTISDGTSFYRPLVTAVPIPAAGS